MPFIVPPSPLSLKPRKSRRCPISSLTPFLTVVRNNTSLNLLNGFLNLPFTISLHHQSIIDCPLVVICFCILLIHLIVELFHLLLSYSHVKKFCLRRITQAFITETFCIACFVIHPALIGNFELLFTANASCQ